VQRTPRKIECEARYGDDREKIHHGDPEAAEEE